MNGILVIDAGVIAHPLWDAEEVMRSLEGVGRASGDICVVMVPPQVQPLDLSNEHPGIGHSKSPEGETAWKAIHRLGWRLLLKTLPTARYDGTASDLVARGIEHAHHRGAPAAAFASLLTLNVPPRHSGMPAIGISPWPLEMSATMLGPALGGALMTARVANGLEEETF